MPSAYIVTPKCHGIVQSSVHIPITCSKMDMLIGSTMVTGTSMDKDRGNIALLIRLVAPSEQSISSSIHG